MTSFYEWLGWQTERQDPVGVLARLSRRDKIFPRDVNKLVLLLSRYEGLPEQRSAVKAAHKEWRAFRQTRRAA